MLEAELLQQRHQFAAALERLDRTLLHAPDDVRALALRANIQLVRGQFMNARRDCMALLAQGAGALGTGCVAEVLAGTGDLARAQTLLEPQLAASNATGPVHSWLFSIDADIADRRGDAARAESSWRAALKADQGNEPARAELADALIRRGAAREALALVDGAPATVALLLRKLQAQIWLGADARTATRRSLDERLEVDALRGERLHLREAAELTLRIDKEPAAALPLATENFEVQRETRDARLLHDAAVATADPVAGQTLTTWMAKSGYRDVYLR